MKCALCNNEVVRKTGSIDFEVRSLGKISVPNLEFVECIGCGDKLLTAEQSDMAFEFIANEEQKLINKLPVGEFVTANEAAVILGVTKQAFSKNPKIKRGFIFSTTIGDRKYYHRISVELFKETGNGKFRLTQVYEIPFIYSLDDNIGAEADLTYEPLQDFITVESFTNKAHSFLKTAERSEIKFATNATSGFSCGYIEDTSFLLNPIQEEQYGY